jgi:hypothetical protein
MLQLRQLVVQSGQRIYLRDIDWSEFEAILQELGDRRTSRVAYFDHRLESGEPLPNRSVIPVTIKFALHLIIHHLPTQFLTRPQRHNTNFGEWQFSRNAPSSFS